MEFNFIQVIGIVLAVLLIVSSIIIGRKKSQKEKSTEMGEMKESKNQSSKDNFLLDKGISISPETNSTNDIDSFEKKSSDYWQNVLDADKKVNAEKNWDRSSSKKYFS